VDNDCDGNADCADSNCNGDPCGANGRICSGGSCICPGGSTESNCSDGQDNDCDGSTDCADSSCNGDPCGAYGRICSGGACVCPGNAENTGPLCNDGVDNDCDGDTDDDDIDCCGLHGMPSCSGSCDTGLQECQTGLCWHCCNEPFENGICGTRPDNVTPCNSDPAGPYFDEDCCGGHGQPGCGAAGCDNWYHQVCGGDGSCWYCCGDGTTNGICGVRPNQTTPCNSDPAGPYWDADC
jgi:hypothetical protein